MPEHFDAIDRNRDDSITLEEVRRLEAKRIDAALDALIVFGDDQNESYLEDCRPAFAIYYGETIRNDVKQHQTYSHLPEWYIKNRSAFFEPEAPRDYPVHDKLAAHIDAVHEKALRLPHHPRVYFEDQAPIEDGSVDERLMRMNWAIAEGQKAEAYGLFLGLTKNPENRKRLKDAILFAGIIDLQDTIINRGGYQNIGHKALRARALVDIAD